MGPYGGAGITTFLACSLIKRAVKGQRLQKIKMIYGLVTAHLEF